ncbi:hypothetical protein [Pseudomonas juntendi]|uniref:hypothetical protein n=1 Tax=Pseudomonas juntendi TaxID=2666183 RepID=UPI001F2973C0|nr:hypothetical protein [Pseudomonas juntendi]
MRILIGAVGLALLAGCATSPIPADKADPVPASRLFAFGAHAESQLVVTRDSGLYGAGCNYRLYIDGVLAAEFASGEVARFGIKPGKHVVGLKPSAACGGWGLVERELDARAGEVIRRRITLSGDSFDISPTAI